MLSPFRLASALLRPRDSAQSTPPARFQRFSLPLPLHHHHHPPSRTVTLHHRVQHHFQRIAPHYNLPPTGTTLFLVDKDIAIHARATRSAGFVLTHHPSNPQTFPPNETPSPRQIWPAITTMHRTTFRTPLPTIMATTGAAAVGRESRRRMRTANTRLNGAPRRCRRTRRMLSTCRG